MTYEAGGNCHRWQSTGCIIARGYRLAGDWASRWGLNHRAIKYYKTAIEKGPGSAHVYEKLGGLLLDKEKADEGVDPFRKAIELESVNARYMHMGNALYERKE